MVRASESYVKQYSVLRVRNVKLRVSYNNGVERDWQMIYAVLYRVLGFGFYLGLIDLLISP
jgi:hypothetical protein